MYYVLPITAEGSTHTNTRKGDFGGNDVHGRLFCRTQASNRVAQRPTSLCVRFFPYQTRRGRNARVDRFISARRATTTTTADAKTRRYKLFLVDGFCIRPADSQMSSSTEWGCPCSPYCRVHTPFIWRECICAHSWTKTRRSNKFQTNPKYSLSFDPRRRQQICIFRYIVSMHRCEWIGGWCTRWCHEKWIARARLTRPMRIYWFSYFLASFLR